MANIGPELLICHLAIHFNKAASSLVKLGQTKSGNCMTTSFQGFFKGKKIIIPKAIQPAILKLVHSSHLSIEKCKR